MPERTKCAFSCRLLTFSHFFTHTIQRIHLFTSNAAVRLSLIVAERFEIEQ